MTTPDSTEAKPGVSDALIGPLRWARFPVFVYLSMVSCYYLWEISALAGLYISLLQNMGG